MTTPLAVIAFNRAVHLRACLEALARCEGLEACSVHILCDGARHPAEEGVVAETRRVAAEWVRRHPGAETVLQPSNLGLSRSVVGAASRFCAEAGRVIVVEDDLVVAPGFVRFMLNGLARFAEAADVYQVAGYMFPVRHPRQPECFLLPMVTTWGWATWERAWHGVDWAAAGALDRLRNRRVQRVFNLDGSYLYTQALCDRLEGNNQSWGILWWWHVFSRGGMSLFPARTLVANEGFDGTGYHCPDGDWRGGDTIENVNAPVGLPETVRVDERAFRRVTRFIRVNSTPKRVLSLRALLWRMVAGIRRSVK